MDSQHPLVTTVSPILGMASDSNPLAGAFGSMIGYLGAEAGEPYVFERLLWPQRFYNYNSLGVMIKSAFLMPIGGPFHKAALETLDQFRRKGLYRGTQRGHMLGTAFYADSGLRVRLHAYEGKDYDTEVRNGLWALVLRRVPRYLSDQPQTSKSGSDPEGQSPPPRRTTQWVNHLQLSVADGSTDGKYKVFCEDKSGWATPIVMVTSELSAILCALAVILMEHRYYWFAVYMCVPVLLKLISLVCSVRREPASQSVKSSLGDEMLVEIDDYDHGFPLISGPEEVVRQFFRHWGHPVRQTQYDRYREISGITLVLSFVLYFPVGLLSMLWVNSTVQMVWLGYQLYLILVMHFNRLIGFEGPGRLDDRLAYELVNKGSVGVRSKSGETVVARLSSTPVSRIREGKEEVQRIVCRHQEKISLLRRSDSSSSNASTLADMSEAPMLGKHDRALST